ncbi:hypothetical protein CFC21_085749 [Triticum aestivum]|uniref:non-specific serine/threonine protein kinase n=2 Tax=Triticum aestivum TaxID=4565 RepID=A0A3B6PFW1_WHEAT|nr:CBL-interacting protein kinase 26-like isoform X3 [Triticum aestivum]KAF7081842.1 hypothetical protein CFC21_085749 [Triticum aestivum]
MLNVGDDTVMCWCANKYITHNTPILTAEASETAQLSLFKRYVLLYYLQMDHETSAKHKALEGMLLDARAEPTDLPLSLLREITNGFSDDLQIGNGGFAVVYKGMLGKGMVAVKRLSERFDIKEIKFNEEVSCLLNVKHKNIVRFLGYCSDTQGIMMNYEGKNVLADVRQRLLCFEYLAKGSLDKYITGPSCGLEWRKRYLIIKGVCEGLYYLHVKQRIVHLDLKPANILLDDNMAPKIADFGLSRRFDEKQSRDFTSKLMGTLGYLAPEFLSGEITFKLDIYSLGVIIIEILTGKKGYHDVEDVLGMSWNRLAKSHGDIQLERAETGIECTENKATKGLVTQHITDRLDEAESTGWSIKTSGSNLSVVQVEKDFTELNLWELKVPGETSNEDSISLIQASEQIKTKSTCHTDCHSSASPTEQRCQMEVGTLLMRRYETGKPLAQGNFGKTYFAWNIINGERVVIKVIDKDKVMRGRLMVQKEKKVSIVRKITHPNIVQLSEVMATKSKIYLVLEYARGGELFNKISKGKFSEDVAWRYFHQLISAVGHCHSLGVYHGDLKPENLLLDEVDNLKVSGFGLSALADPKRQDGRLHTTYGTPAYVAPEVLSGRDHDGAKADIWFCGVILLALVAGDLPFQDTTLTDMYTKISRGEYSCPCPLSAELEDLLSMILHQDPSARASVLRIKRSAWFRKHEARDKIYKDGDKTSDLMESINTYRNQTSARLTNMNAFDIISLSSGYDLSSLFEEYGRCEYKFTSMQPAEIIFAKLSELAKQLKVEIKERENGVVKLAAPKEGRKGFVELDAKVFELTESVVLVELRQTNGDTIEYKHLVEDEIRPAFKDEVWVWQDEPEHYIQGGEQQEE